MGQPMISEGPLSAKVVLVGAQRTNCDPEGPPKFLIFPFVTMEKNVLLPEAVGPGKKFRVSHPLSGPALVTFNYVFLL